MASHIVRHQEIRNQIGSRLVLSRFFLTGTALLFAIGIVRPAIVQGQVTNGGFDIGNQMAGWATSGGFNPPPCNLISPRSSPYYACFTTSDGTGAWGNNLSGTLGQSIYIDQNASQATLKFYYRIGTTEISSTVDFDHFYAYLIPQSGGSVEILHRTNRNGVPQASLGPWTQFSDSSTLLGYKGQNVIIYFTGSTDVINPSTFHLDDVGVTQVIPCSYSLSAPSASFGSSGGSGSFNVTTPASCFWSASSNQTWVTTSSSSTGNGAVNYSVAQNTGTSGRDATITVGGQTFGVHQDGVNCSYSLSAPSASFGPPGGSGSFNVTAPAGCFWSASSNQTWVTTSSSSTGNGAVNYSVAQNTNTTGRDATITVVGQTFAVHQDGQGNGKKSLRMSVKFVLDANGNRPAGNQYHLDLDIRRAILQANQSLQRLNADWRIQLTEIIDAAGIPQWYGPFENPINCLRAYELEEQAEANPNQYLWKADAINVYVVNDFASNCGGACSFPGYPFEIIWIQSTGIANDGIGWLHEVGHFLNLCHTFGCANAPGPCTGAGGESPPTACPENCPDTKNVMSYFQPISSSDAALSSCQLDLMQNELLGRRIRFVGYVSNWDIDCDGVSDNADGCPEDPVKSAPGACGCGNSDLDADSDGVAGCLDCNDANPAVRPGATEICGNGIDDDCAGGDAVCPPTWNRDADGDLFGNPADSQQSIAQPSGFVLNGNDCDDANAAVHPGAAEICGNGLDDDCSEGDAVCPQTGACCLDGDTCDTGYAESACVSRGGVWQGLGTTTCANCEPFVSVQLNVLVGGDISGDPILFNGRAGQPMMLSAPCRPGERFLYWSGGGLNGREENPITINPITDMKVFAVHERVFTPCAPGVCTVLPIIGLAFYFMKSRYRTSLAGIKLGTNSPRRL